MGVPKLSLGTRSTEQPSTVVLLHDSDGPEVGGEIGICEIGKGDGEVAAHSPSSSPAVAAEEPAPGRVVADGTDGVAAEDRFAGLRHRGVAGTRHRVTFEAFVNGEPEHERITGSEATLHLREGLNQPLIADGGVFCRFGIASS